MSYENFKKFVIAKTDNFDFGDPANEKFIENIVNYFSTGPTTLDRKKGLFVRGSIGVGKTSFLRLIQKWLPQEKKFMYNPANEVVSLFNASGDDALTVYKKKKERFFDDVGAEDMGKNYGNSIEVFEKIFYSRYDILTDEGIRTHITSNLSNERLFEKYGKRAVDRFKVMFNDVIWNSTESKRGLIGWTYKPEKNEEATKEPTTEDLIRFRYEYIQNCFLKPYEALKTGRNVFDPQNSLFFFIQMNNNLVFNITEEQTSHYRNKALQHLSETARNATNNRKEFKDLVSKLQLEITGVKTDKHLKVKEYAAHLYFVDWCRNSIKQNLDIEQFLIDNEFYNPST